MQFLGSDCKLGSPSRFISQSKRGGAPRRNGLLNNAERKMENRRIRKRNHGVARATPS